jgi:hypothetical protein
MKRRALGRRRFLELVGATALTYPFLRGLPSYAAEGGTAAGGGDPVYLVLLFTSCGTVRYRWGAQGSPPTSTTPTVTSPLQFRPLLSAFTQSGPMKVDLTDKVTVLDGLQVMAAGGGSHEAGMAALWTGLTTSGSAATGPSIDTAISAALNAPTPYANIPLMVQSSADYQQRQVDTRMLYDATGNFVDPYTSPSAALGTLFPTMPAATSSGPDKKTFLRQKVAAQLNQDLTALQSRLCTEDRQQLQNLQAIWNQVEMQIQSAAAAAASCNAPTLPAGADVGSGGDPFPVYAQVMPSILAMALACDLTRVASLQYSHALSPVTHTWLGSSQTSTHHIYSHQGPTWIGALGADPYASTASVASQYPQQLVDIESWYAAQVAGLAYTLSQLKTASGKSLLDQTVVCWGTELDMGAAHNHDNTPFVLIGGGGGRIKTNQLVRFQVQYGQSAQNNAAGTRFHNDLLLTLAKVMGVSLPGGTFGTPTYCTGPIDEVLA